LRDTDPDYFETRCEWNADSLCTLITSPEGNSTELIYESKFFTLSTHAHRNAGNLRILRERASCCADIDSDGDGVVDATERTWRIEYEDPNFGSPLRVGFPGPMAPPMPNIPIPGERRGRSSYAAITIEQGLTHDSSFERRLPGRTTFQPITLEQGLTHDLRSRYRRVLLQQGRILLDTDGGGSDGGQSDGRRSVGKRYRRVLLQQGRILTDSDQPIVTQTFDEGFPTMITDPIGNV